MQEIVIPSLKKVLLAVIVVGILVLIKLVSRSMPYSPTYQKQFDITQKNNTSEFVLDTRGKDCTEVGFLHPTMIFDTNTRGSYKDVGEYKFEYFAMDGKLLESKTITRGRGIKSTNTNQTSLFALDVFEVPFHKQYEKVKLRVTVLAVEPKLLNQDKPYSFYLDKNSYWSCGKAYENEMKTLEHKKMLEEMVIQKVETNATLKPLFWALMTKQPGEVKKLTPSKFDINIKMVGDRTPLHYAAFVNDSSSTQYLLDHGATIDAKDVYGRPPLYYAILNNSVDTVRLLLTNGANMKIVNSIQYDYNISKEFHQEKIFNNSASFPPLLYTTFLGMIDMTRVLLDLRYDVFKNKRYGQWTLYTTVTNEFSARKRNNKLRGLKEDIPYEVEILHILKDYGFKSDPIPDNIRGTVLTIEEK